MIISQKKISQKKWSIVENEENESSGLGFPTFVSTIDH
jgi:hypothetical protein